MEQQTHKRLYDTHAWVGIISGILLFIVTFSGIPALFDHELEYWQYPEYTVLDKTTDFDLERSVETAQNIGFHHSNYFVQPPNEINNHIILAHFPEKKEDGTRAEPDIRYLSATNYQPIPESPSEMAHLLTHLHTDLHLPNPIGRYLVGLSGMAMLLAIIAGIFIHVKWRKEFVMLRPKRSWRLLLTDQHKLLGLWSLPFTFILAFTGTILGLLGIISPILAVAAFSGDVQKATDAVLGPRAEIIGEAAPVAPLNQLFDKAQFDLPDADIDFIQIHGLGDKGGIVKFSASHNKNLSNLESVTYSAVDGSTIHQGTFLGKGPFQRIFAAVTPLHYVLFGSIWLKVCYALAALAACGLIVTGNMLWLERRGHGMQHWLSKLTLGICGGLVLATAAVFPISQGLYLSDLGSLHHTVEEFSFWGIWLAIIGLAFIYKQGFVLSHWILRLSAISLFTTLILDGVINHRWIWNSESWVLYVQSGIAFFATVFAYLDFKLPNQRKEKFVGRSEKIENTELASDGLNVAESSTI